MPPPRPSALVSAASPSFRGHLGVRLDPELEASLQLVAGQIGCSLSVCVRRALRLYLRQFRETLLAETDRNFTELSRNPPNLN